MVVRRRIACPPGADPVKGHGCTHVHPIIFAKKSRLVGIKWPNSFQLGFGCLVSHSRKGSEEVGIPSGCSWPAKRPTSPRHLA